MASSPPTAIGYYTAADVARLAGVSSQKIGQWARRGIIRPSVSRRPNIYSYADAGEAILAHYLVQQGNRPAEVRAVVEALRQDYGEWPLATAPIEHEGKLVVMRDEAGPHFYSVGVLDKHALIGGTLLDLKVIREALSHGGWVAIDHPREHIEVDPDRHSGEPVIRGRRLSTRRVAELAATKEGRKSLQEDYRLSTAEIEDAVGYERDLEALAA
jgi:uncharacterized protein (DUF433 family)